MKRDIILMALALASSILVFSCDDENTGGKLDQDANIYINGKESANKSMNLTSSTDKQRRLSVEEICKGDSLCLVAYKVGSQTQEEIFEEKFIYNGSIDTVKNRIALRAGNITALEKNEFLMAEWKWYIMKLCWLYNGDDEDGKPMYVGAITKESDTVAYIPTEQRLAVVDTLSTLFEDKEGNWNEIYKIFNDAFVFIPCTGEEYRALEASGMN